MRKIVALAFISLDGVMQSPGGRNEDTSGGFKYGGWLVPYFDEALGEEISKQMDEPFDMLLGRKTYDVFASYWPNHKDEGPGIDKATKYVVSNEPVSTDWKETVQIKGDVVAKMKKLKEQDGPMIQVHGSSNLMQTLLANDLVDELWLKIFPIVLGKGKRLFGDGAMPASFELTHSKVSPSGVIIASYKRAGDVRTGDMGA